MGGWFALELAAHTATAVKAVRTAPSFTAHGGQALAVIHTDIPWLATVVLDAALTAETPLALGATAFLATDR